MRHYVLMIALVAACGSETENSAPKLIDDTPEQVEGNATPADPAVGEAAGVVNTNEVHTATLMMPTPLETATAVDRAGLNVELGQAAPAWDFTIDKTKVAPKNVTAVRVGVLSADLVLDAEQASNEDLAMHLGMLRIGLEQLGASGAILESVGTLQQSVLAEALTGPALVAELDALAGSGIADLKLEDAWIVPAIQAGAWLEGAYLTAQAAKASGSPSIVDEVLKQPKVPEHFSGLLDGEAGDAVDSGVWNQTQSTLDKLKLIAAKKEPLTEADLTAMIATMRDLFVLIES